MNAPLARAVRTVDRWALVAGVTGLLANVLLVALFTTPADGPYAWTGPANDVVGDASNLATIPVAVGLLAVCGHRRGLGVITSLAIVAMAVMTTVSMLMVLGLAPFATATDSAYIGMIFLFGWVFAAGGVGADAGPLADLGHHVRRRMAGGHPDSSVPGVADCAVLSAARPPAGRACLCW